MFLEFTLWFVYNVPPLCHTGLSATKTNHMCVQLILNHIESCIKIHFSSAQVNLMSFLRNLNSLNSSVSEYICSFQPYNVYSSVCHWHHKYKSCIRISIVCTEKTHGAVFCSANARFSHDHAPKLLNEKDFINLIQWQIFYYYHYYYY